MAPRSIARAVASSSSTPALARGSPAIAQPASTTSPQLLELRRQWKWAAFSQFFFTFATLFALDDVTLVDVEEDLVNSTMIALPRVMQRLLLTLTQDRKINVENWQQALRRQYLRRDPQANPLGPEHAVSRTSRATTVDSEIKLEDDASEELADGEERLSSRGATGKQRQRRSTSSEEEPSAGEADDGRLALDESAHIDQEEREGTKDWMDLPMLDKLESIHMVLEWHFQMPLRLRTVMRSDDENASWRIEPIGYDAKRNAYWLIGPDRLWLQRLPPKPPKKNLKRKAPSDYSKHKVKAPRVTQIESDFQAEQSPMGMGRRSKVKIISAGTGSANGDRNANGLLLGSSRSSEKSKIVEERSLSMPGGAGRARAAKTQANVKLDLQAKQLAVAKAELQSFNRRSTKNPAVESPGRRVLGTRTSRRLRGGEEDEWQQVPPEWLSSNEESPQHSFRKSARTNARSNGTPRQWNPSPIAVATSSPGREKTWLESDDESDLTELSDSETSSQRADGDRASKAVAENDKPSRAGNGIPDPWPPSDFIEWETICVSLHEWGTIADQFEKSSHYLEKALYKTLAQEIVPFVTESLRDVERQRLKEEALMSRKRSSRIAVKETEKEIARLTALKQAEEEEKLARVRRLEARAHREEEERLKREIAREQRRREREEREAARAKRKDNPIGAMDLELADEKPDSNDVDVHSGSYVAPRVPRRAVQRKNAKEKNSRDDWELDCEICGSRGVNRDGDLPLMSCGNCNRWQHIRCHDDNDIRAGRVKRNWDVVEFTCRRCQSARNGGSSQPNYNAPRWQYDQHTHPKLLESSSASSLQSSSGFPPYNASSGNGYANRPDSRGAVNDQKVSTNYAYQSYTPASRSHSYSNGNGAAPSKGPSYQTSVTFAHYQPLQRGFSHQPTTLQAQQQANSYGSTHLSSAHVTTSDQRNTLPWIPQQGYTFPNQTTIGNASPDPSHVITHNPNRNGTALSQNTSRPHQLFPVSSNVVLNSYSHHNVQYPQTYPNSQQQPTSGAQPYYSS